MAYPCDQIGALFEQQISFARNQATNLRNEKLELTAELQVLEGSTDTAEDYHNIIIQRFNDDVMAGNWQLKYPADIIIPQNNDDTCDIESLKTELIMAINENQAEFMTIRDLFNCKLWIQQEIDKLQGNDDQDPPMGTDSTAMGGDDMAMITVVDDDDDAGTGGNNNDGSGVVQGGAAGIEDGTGDNGGVQGS